MASARASFAGVETGLRLCASGHNHVARHAPQEDLRLAGVRCEAWPHREVRREGDVLAEAVCGGVDHEALERLARARPGELHRVEPVPLRARPPPRRRSPPTARPAAARAGSSGARRRPQHRLLVLVAGFQKSLQIELRARLKLSPDLQALAGTKARSTLSPASADNTSASAALCSARALAVARQARLIERALGEVR